MPAQAEEIEAAEREGVVVRTGLAPVEVVSRDGAVVALRCDVDPSDRRHGHDRRRQLGAGPAPRSRDLPAPTILVAIGEEPDPSILPEGAGIEISGWAGVVADARTLATGRTGVFAGGDVVSGPKTIIDAVAAGRRAAASIHGISRASPTARRVILETVRYRDGTESAAHARPADAAACPRAAADDRYRARSRPTQVGFDAAMAQAEAARASAATPSTTCPTVDVRGRPRTGDRPRPRPRRACPPGGQPADEPRRMEVSQ